MTNAVGQLVRGAEQASSTAASALERPEDLLRGITDPARLGAYLDEVRSILDLPRGALSPRDGALPVLHLNQLSADQRQQLTAALRQFVGDLSLGDLSPALREELARGMDLPRPIDLRAELWSLVPRGPTGADAIDRILTALGGGTQGALPALAFTLATDGARLHGEVTQAGASADAHLARDGMELKARAKLKPNGQLATSAEIAIRPNANAGISMRAAHGPGGTTLAADGNVGNTRAVVTYERNERGTSVRGDISTSHGATAAAASFVHEGGKTHVQGEVSHQGVRAVHNLQGSVTMLGREIEGGGGGYRVEGQGKNVSGGATTGVRVTDAPVGPRVHGELSAHIDVADRVEVDVQARAGDAEGQPDLTAGLQVKGRF